MGLWVGVGAAGVGTAPGWGKGGEVWEDVGRVGVGLGWAEG